MRALATFVDEAQPLGCRACVLKANRLGMRADRREQLGAPGHRAIILHIVSRRTSPGPGVLPERLSLQITIIATDETVSPREEAHRRLDRRVGAYHSRTAGPEPESAGGTHRHTPGDP